MSNRHPEKLSEKDANLYFIIALREFLNLKPIKCLMDEDTSDEEKGSGKRGPRKINVPYLQVIEGGADPDVDDMIVEDEVGHG